MKGVFIFLFLVLGVVSVLTIAYFVKIIFFKNKKMPSFFEDIPEADEADLTDSESGDLEADENI